MNTPDLNRRAKEIETGIQIKCDPQQFDLLIKQYSRFSHPRRFLTLEFNPAKGPMPEIIETKKVKTGKDNARLS